MLVGGFESEILEKKKKTKVEALLLEKRKYQHLCLDLRECCASYSVPSIMISLWGQEKREGSLLGTVQVLLMNIKILSWNAKD